MHLRLFAPSLLAAIALLAAGALPTAAQQPGDGQSQTYITPFPDGDSYRLHVIGDWQAEGLLPGLNAALQSETRNQLVLPKKTQPIVGLARPETEDQLGDLEEFIAREPMQIAVVFIGGADRTHIRSEDGKRIRLGSEEWRAEYSRRVERMTRAFKSRNVAVYWVGQPILRRAEANDDVQVLNDVVRERAVLSGQRFIDTYQGFADEDGNYNAYGPDLSGKIRQLRSSDGNGFTSDGYRKLAHFIERELKRDLTQALAERSLPLAGSEAEQAKINPGRAIAAQAAQRAAQGPAPGAAVPKSARDLSNWTTTVQTPPTSTAPGSERRADNGRITLRAPGAGGREEIVQVDIVRPAIPANALALASRRAASEKVAQFGDFVRDATPDGMLLLSSVSASGDGGQRRARSDAFTQTAYYRVMVRGDRIPAKPGRADDQSWPRTDAVVEAPPAAAPAAPVSAPPTRQRTPARGQQRTQ
jgi:hypothetical protein